MRTGFTQSFANTSNIPPRIENSPGKGYPSLAELADICGISEGHLARSFKAATGWQIQKYIAEERLALAKSLLADSETSCEAIAEQLGYGSAAYFSTSFRRATGRTPTAFRRLAATGAGDTLS